MKDIYAVLNDLTSATININSIAPTHTTKVMVEDYTGTWCGWCPRLAAQLEDAVNQNNNVVPVAIHNENPGDYGYSMRFNQEGVLRSAFGITSFPTGKINRTIDWDESVGQPIFYLNSTKNLGLAINSSLSGNTISADVKVHYDLGATEQNRLVVYLLENGLVYNQENYLNGDPTSPWYQAGNPIVGFVHDHVVRIAFTDVFGVNIPTADSATGSTYTANLSVAVPASVQNTSNLELVAFVVGTNNTVINVQKADLGVNQDFD